MPAVSPSSHHGGPGTSVDQRSNQTGPDSPAGGPFYTAGTAVCGIPLTEEERGARPGTRHGHLLNDIPPGLNYSFYTGRMGHPRPLFQER